MKRRLILHSDQSLKTTVDIDRKLLLSLTGKRSPRLGYVPSAPDRRRRYFLEKQDYYRTVGVADVRFFDPCEESSPEEREAILQCDALHLTGGVVGEFRNRLQESGFDAHLRAFVARGGVIVGVSAGAMLLGKTFELAKVFGEKGPFDGLGLFDFEIFPHRKEMGTRLGAVRDFARRTGRSVWALDDGEVLVVNGEKITSVGAPELIPGGVS